MNGGTSGATLIPSETIERIRERVDIVDVIGEFVQLRRAGTNFKGLCPFHQEKTPSFNVNPARQVFHCFGCHEGGDIFSFLMKYEGRTFGDAVQLLGQRAGIEVVEQKLDKGELEARQQRQAEREKLLTMMDRVTAFYRDQLLGNAGRAARDYLASRGIDRSVADRFSLGYAPPGWDALATRLGGLGISSAEAERLGLVAPRRSGSGTYDRLRDRLVFPIHDAVGRTIAFSARVLPGAPDDAPKYVNSPETPLYSKTRTLYGLHLARPAMRRDRRAIVVEGNVDVISLHAHGFDSTVAPMGTALTAEQVTLVRRFAGNDASMVLVFDGDEAGQKAMERAHPAVAGGGLGARVALLPPDEDPDTFVRGRGPAAFASLVDGAVGLVEHLIDAAARASGEGERDRAVGIRSLEPVLSNVRDALERQLYVKRIARAFKVPEELVSRTLRGTRPDEESDRAPVRSGRRKRAEVVFVGALIDQPELVKEVQIGGVKDLVKDPLVTWLLDRLPDVAQGRTRIEDLVNEAPDENLTRWVSGRIASPEYTDIDVARKAMDDSLSKLRTFAEKAEAKQVLEEVEHAEHEGDHERAARLSQERLQRAKERQRERTAGSTGGASRR